MKIGPYQLDNNLCLAPMAGVTDWPFRLLCREMGAGLVVSEMLSANPELWQTKKSLQRNTHKDEAYPRSVQIAGGDPKMLAEAAKYNVDLGAQIIDINMGCPAKKVCKVDAGSALLKDEKLVANILEAVVNAVDVPVTLKIRTGWCPKTKNALTIAQIAEKTGISALAIHGRTREDKYKGEAEYDTIKLVKENVNIPIIANGDINTPEKAKFVLEYTRANGIMIGRAAQGRPWIFREVEHYLNTGKRLPEPSFQDIGTMMLNHLKNIYDLYGTYVGVWIARKHVGWYLSNQRQLIQHRKTFNKITTTQEQLEKIKQLFNL